MFLFVFIDFVSCSLSHLGVCRISFVSINFVRCLVFSLVLILISLILLVFHVGVALDCLFSLIMLVFNCFVFVPAEIVCSN